MWARSAKSLVVELNNLRVIDLTLLHSSYSSLTVAGMNLLLEGLYEPSVKYKYPAVGYGQWLGFRRLQQDNQDRKYYGQTVIR